MSERDFRKRLKREKRKRADESRREAKAERERKRQAEKDATKVRANGEREDEKKRKAALKSIERVEQKLNVSKHIKDFAAMIRPHRGVRRVVEETGYGSLDSIEVFHKIMKKTDRWKATGRTGGSTLEFSSVTPRFIYKKGKTDVWWGVQLECDGKNPDIVRIHIGEGNDVYKADDNIFARLEFQKSEISRHCGSVKINLNEREDYLPEFQDVLSKTFEEYEWLKNR